MGGRPRPMADMEIFFCHRPNTTSCRQSTLTGWFIEEMSRYLAANGKSYQNYAAALRIWAGNDKKEAPKKGIPDYSCKEGESL